MPRWSDALLRWLLPTDRYEEIAGDLSEEYSRRGLGGRAKLTLARELWAVLVPYVGRRIVARARDASERGSGMLGWRTGLSDLAPVLRAMRRQPRFPMLAVGTVALGIGLNATIFSVVDSVLLTKLPYPDDEELVSLYVSEQARDGRRDYVSPPDYFDWIEASQTVGDLAGYWSPVVEVEGHDGIERIRAATVTHNLTRVLRVAPALGRGFVASDDLPGAPRVVLLAHRAWQQRYGGDPGIVGRQLTISGRPATVVGVMPRSFSFPRPETELWFPLGLEREAPQMQAPPYRAFRILNVVGRLRSGHTLDDAVGEFRLFGEHRARQFPDTHEGWRVRVVPLFDDVVGGTRDALAILLVASACLLLIALANVSGLLLARAASRREEFGLRLALGAGRLRLMRQLMTEGAILSGLGAVIGLLMAHALVGYLPRLLPPGFPRVEILHVGPRVLLAVAGVWALSTILFGLASLAQGPASQLGELLHRGARTDASAGRAPRRFVVVQTALATALALGAVLFVRTFVSLNAVDAGFHPDEVVTARVALPRDPETVEQNAIFFSDVVSHLERHPDFESAGMSLGLPLGPDAELFVASSAFQLPERPEPASSVATAPIHIVDGKFFETLQIPIVDGRAFESRDAFDATPVAVVNRAFVDRYFHGDSPIGHRLVHEIGFIPGLPTDRQIVGVVGDVRFFGVNAQAPPQIYLPHSQVPWPDMAIAVRTSRPKLVAAAIRDAVRALDARAALEGAVALGQMRSDSLAQPRLRAILLGSFALTALILVGIGVYALLSFSVARSQREIGVRLALGARPAELRRRIVASGLRLAAAGFGVGLAIAFGAARLASSVLVGVSGLDPVAIVLVVVTLALTAVLASDGPARRATRVDPLTALKED